MKTAGKALGILALAVAPLAAGGGMLLMRHYSLKGMRAAQSWVETPCVMERCEFVRSRTSGRNQGQTLEIRYRYEVDGREYKGDQLDLIVGRFGDDLAYERTVLKEYPVGASAVCYVDPADPTRSVFNRDRGQDGPRRMWMLAYPFICTGMGFWLVLVGAFTGRSKDEPCELHPDVRALIARPGPPPRRIPWRTRAAILAGPPGSQYAWMFLVGFGYLFVLMDGPAAYARLFDSTANKKRVFGRVTDVIATQSREMYATLYENRIAYEIDGRKYTSGSFTRGRPYDQGEEVPILFHPDQPEKGVIEGARASEMAWWISAIPLGIVLLLLLGLFFMYRHSFRVLRLLRHGQVARARWKEPPKSTDADAGAGGDQIQTLLSEYHFEAAGRTYRAIMHSPGKRRRHRRSDATEHADSSEATGPPLADDEALVLYNPRNPKRNVLLTGPLAEQLRAWVTPGDHVMQCISAPLAILAIVVLLYGAELV